jgi:hypothetical protein
MPADTAMSDAVSPANRIFRDRCGSFLTTSYGLCVFALRSFFRVLPWIPWPVIYAAEAAPC